MKRVTYLATFSDRSASVLIPYSKRKRLQTYELDKATCSMPKLPGSKAGKGVEPWVRFLKKGVVLDQPVLDEVSLSEHGYLEFSLTIEDRMEILNF